MKDRTKKGPTPKAPQNSMAPHGKASDGSVIVAPYVHNIPDLRGEDAPEMDHMKINHQRRDVKFTGRI